MDDARAGLATRYVLPLWDAPRKPAGEADSTGKALARQADGTWWYHVRKPNSDGSAQWKAQWASLELCNRTGLPIIGVLKDRHSRLCALDVTFDCGPFSGSFEDGEVWMQAHPRDAKAVELLTRHYGLAQPPMRNADLAQESEVIEQHSYFNATDPQDERKRRLREVVQRRGQSEFRRALLLAYGERCAVTGCDAADALEAAHIIGYFGPASQHVSNGLLLRADIHTLFDLDLLSICPDTLQIHLAPALRATSYAPLHGKTLTCPSNPAFQPSREALHTRWRNQS
ncbi:HNH endonuclease [Noviherbaspirillum malthae]|uniref:HNH endonuclease n=1 Tax=Noviherbaspirillum malthae TaxID=1260987 RepID=UPI00188F2FA2|nr:HNH endonuclease [Noviherbaspirillum malthae]